MRRSPSKGFDRATHVRENSPDGHTTCLQINKNTLPSHPALSINPGVYLGIHYSNCFYIIALA